MNIHQIKQYAHSFFYDDANSRERNRAAHVTGLFFGSPFLMGEGKRAHVAGMSLMSPDLTKVWGTDISHWDGNVNLTVTKGRGASFVFIKGLDGTLQTRFFAENRQRAIGAGLLQAPYQWLYRGVNVSCIAQAQAMKNLLDKYPSDLPPVIDFEWTYWGGAQANPSWNDLDAYVTELLRLGVRKPILYTAKGYADMFGRMPDALRAKFSAFWFANYGVMTPALPLGFTSWDFWQFTSSGDASVYSPNDNGKLECDMNYWRGTVDELNQFAGAVVPPPKPGGKMIYNITNNSTTSTRTIRRGPGVVFGSVDNLPAGGTATGDYCYSYDAVNTTLQASAGDKWIQIGINRWLAWVHKGVAYLNVTAVPEPSADLSNLSVHLTQELDINGNRYAVSNVELPKV